MKNHYKSYKVIIIHANFIPSKVVCLKIVKRGVHYIITMGFFHYGSYESVRK